MPAIKVPLLNEDAILIIYNDINKPLLNKDGIQVMKKHLGFKTINTNKTRLNKARQQEICHCLNSKLKRSTRRDKRKRVKNTAKEL